MTGSSITHLWIVGPGRLGLALGAALSRRAAFESLEVRGRRLDPPDDPLFTTSPGAIYRARSAPVQREPSAVVVAVPDAAVTETAGWLAGLHLPPVPVLHTCGVLGAEALDALARLGFPTGSLHPLVAVADPGLGAGRLIGAWYGIEGQGAALALAETLVTALDGRTFRVPTEQKALYHAAAVFASNYLVALVGLAERLAERAGIQVESIRPAFAELANGAVGNLGSEGPAAALTGPVSRGDVETIRRHLARLSPDDRRLYSGLAREALVLARRAGLEPAAADRVARLLEEEMP